MEGEGRREGKRERETKGRKEGRKGDISGGCVQVYCVVCVNIQRCFIQQPISQLAQSMEGGGGEKKRRDV